MIDKDLVGYVVSGPPRPWYARFFPSEFCDLPEAPAVFKDVLDIRIYITLAWKDRLRALISGRIVAHARVVCENEVGDSVTNSVAYVEAPLFGKSLEFLTTFWTRAQIRVFVELALLAFIACEGTWLILKYVCTFR